MDADVVVIGAGAAGLIAARDLGRGGKRAIVLEATGRAGGRIREAADRHARAPVELGAEFVHGRPQITLDLLEEMGSRVISRGNDDDADDRFDRAGALLVRGLESDPDETVEAMLARLERVGADAGDADEARMLVAGFDAADPARASARAIAREWHGAASASGSQGRPADGYAPLVAHLRASLDERTVDLRTNAVATRIARTANGVDVTVRDDVGDHSLRARHAIVTIPIGVLHAPAGATGAIAFDPPLPERTQRAIASIAMGPVVKVVLVFRDAFWTHATRDVSFVRTDHDFPVYWTQDPRPANTLVAWTGGPPAHKLRGLSNSELIERALEGASAAFGERTARAAFIAGHVHDWQADPFSRGAYSYVLAGGDGAREILAEPIDDRIYIAGEATASDVEGGTVAGALESGVRAARNVLDRR